MERSKVEEVVIEQFKGPRSLLTINGFTIFKNSKCKVKLYETYLEIKDTSDFIIGIIHYDDIETIRCVNA